MAGRYLVLGVLSWADMPRTLGQIGYAPVFQTRAEAEAYRRAAMTEGEIMRIETTGKNSEIPR